MKTSESITKIAPALVKAQKAITFASKNAKNPHFKNNYADLGSVIEAIKAPLNDAGIVFIQSPSPSEDGRLHLTTRLIHESGEWIEDTAVCPMPKADPQGFGSANTYLRRYSLAAIIGLYQDDDDGNAAMKPTPSKPEFKSVPKDVFDGMDINERAFLEQTAEEVRAILKESGPVLANQHMVGMNLDNDEKIALWSLFDSKERSAMKKAQQTQLAEQA